MKKICLTGLVLLTTCSMLGCSTGKQLKERLSKIKDTPKDLYIEYIQEQLFSKYDLADLSNFQTTLSINGEGNLISKGQSLNPKGILSAYIDDLNGDKVDDLFLIYFQEEDEEDEDIVGESGQRYNLMARACTVEDGQLKELGESSLGPMRGQIDSYMSPEPITLYENNAADIRIYINAVTDGEHTYILVENNCLACAFADGSYTSMTAFQLEKEDQNNDGSYIEIAFSFEQSEGGSSNFEYEGYDADGREELLYNTMEGTGPDEEYGTYHSYEAALENFFIDYGIQVNGEEKEWENRSSIVKSQSLKGKILSYKWTSSDLDYDGDGSSAKFKLDANDLKRSRDELKQESK